MTRPRLFMILAALGALAVLAPAPSALAGQPVALKSDLLSEDGRVTLGDLFGGAGEAASVVVASGRAGGDLVLDAARVQMMARAHGLDWDNAGGIRRLVVQPGTVPEPASAITVTAKAPHRVDVLTYARNINPGEVVQPQDLIWAKALAAAPDAPSDPQAVIGMAARRPLREGSLVAVRDVTPPQVIKKDDVIALVYSNDGVTVTLQAKALENAVAGQSFTALNTQSKKVIQAVAMSPGQALVGPQADQIMAAARLHPSLVASIR